MAEWTSVLVECLAGIRDQSGQLRRVELAPAGLLRVARVTARYAASGRSLRAEDIPRHLFFQECRLQTGQPGVAFNVVNRKRPI